MNYFIFTIPITIFSVLCKKYLICKKFFLQNVKIICLIEKCVCFQRIVMLIFIFHRTVECSSPKTDEIVRKNAATQLDRLSLFRKSVKLDKSDEDVKIEQKLATNKLDDLKNSTTSEFTIPIELLQYVRKHFSADASDAQNKKRADELLADPTYNAIMLDRIKRGHSGSFLSGIASKLVGGIASASAGSSSSISQSNNQAYGSPVRILFFKKIFFK